MVVVNKLKMGLQYGNLYTLYIHMQSTMFDIFKNYIIVTCGDYF